jgi:hypothetical protein
MATGARSTRKLAIAKPTLPVSIQAVIWVSSGLPAIRELSDEKIVYQDLSERACPWLLELSSSFLREEALWSTSSKSESM